MEYVNLVRPIRCDCRGSTHRSASTGQGRAASTHPTVSYCLGCRGDALVQLSAFPTLVTSENPLAQPAVLSFVCRSLLPSPRSRLSLAPRLPGRLRPACPVWSHPALARPSRLAWPRRALYQRRHSLPLPLLSPCHRWGSPHSLAQQQRRPRSRHLAFSTACRWRLQTPSSASMRPIWLTDTLAKSAWAWAPIGQTRACPTCCRW